MTDNSKPGRRFRIGDAVVWTDFANGTKHPCEIIGYPEDPDYDPDLNGNGPLYEVRRILGERRESQVAEKDLSPRTSPQADVGDGQLPRDPFSSYDSERIAKETGGQITGSVVWEGKTRLTIGAIERGIWPNLVGIRIFDWNGNPAGEINLGPDDADTVMRALGEAYHICWPAPPDPPFTPRTDWYSDSDDSEPDPDDED
jgi:hypothetical protein